MPEFFLVGELFGGLLRGLLFGGGLGGAACGAASGFLGEGVLLVAPFAGPFEDVGEVAEHFFEGGWAVVGRVWDEVIVRCIIAAEFVGIVRGVGAGVGGGECGFEDVFGEDVHGGEAAAGLAHGGEPALLKVGELGRARGIGRRWRGGWGWCGGT